MNISRVGILLFVSASGVCLADDIAQENPEDSVQIIYQAVAEKPGSAVPEVSTAVLEQILQDQSAVVLDTRPFLEWSVIFPVHSMWHPNQVWLWRFTLLTYQR